MPASVRMEPKRGQIEGYRVMSAWPTGKTDRLFAPPSLENPRTCRPTVRCQIWQLSPYKVARSLGKAAPMAGPNQPSIR